MSVMENNVFVRSFRALVKTSEDALERISVLEDELRAERGKCDIEAEKQDLIHTQLSAWHALLEEKNDAFLQSTRVAKELDAKDAEVLSDFSRVDIEVMRKYAPREAAELESRAVDARRRNKEMQEVLQALNIPACVGILVEQAGDEAKLYAPILFEEQDKPELVRSLAGYVLEKLCVLERQGHATFEEAFQTYGSFITTRVLTDQYTTLLALVQNDVPQGFKEAQIALEVIDLNSITEEGVCQRLTRKGDDLSRIIVHVSEKAIERQVLPVGTKSFWPASERVLLKFEDKVYSCASPKKLTTTRLYNKELGKQLEKSGLHVNGRICYEKPSNEHEQEEVYAGERLPVVTVSLVSDEQ